MKNIKKKQEIARRDKTHLLTDVAFPPAEGLTDYAMALSATGVTVLAFQEFGSYQGDWWAHVQFPNGERYFVKGGFGSCTVCDSFQSEFETWYLDADNPEKKPDYFHRLRDFALEYLRDCRTYEQALEEAGEHSSWDMEAKEMIAWIKAQQVTALPAR